MSAAASGTLPEPRRHAVVLEPSGSRTDLRGIARGVRGHTSIDDAFVDIVEQRFDSGLRIGKTVEREMERCR